MEQLGRPYKVERSWEWKQQLVKFIQLENIEYISLTRLVNLCRVEIESTDGDLITEGIDCKEKQCEFNSPRSMTTGGIFVVRQFKLKRCPVAERGQRLVMKEYITKIPICMDKG